ncbi:hypothetical protein [Leifsonia sp. AG29]|uniref:hypothetical protein n=1 Tax=Leifsonia sp. AG29 TaxID=2598860 RepID=UPI001E476E4A|nr:hypothetical protein [Leifsonia sp. AG29]
MTRRHRLPTVASGALVVAFAGLVLTGCTSSQVRPTDDYAGEPKGVQAPASSAGGSSWASWLDAGQHFGIVLYGSSTCPPKVQSISVEGKSSLKATLAPAPGGVCTRDYVPHTTVFATPSGVKTTAQVTIDLPDSTLTLPGLPG